jgi:hypothetical protein
VTSLPDWLVERAALDEVPAASRARLDAADPRELAERLAALRDDNARELAGYPAGPAVAQLQTAAAKRRLARRRRVQRTLLGVATSAAAVLAIAHFAIPHAAPATATRDSDDGDGIRVKGKARLSAFRQVGDQVEQLGQDAPCNAGDVIQLRYNAGGRRYGVIASVDGAGVVTLHYPASEDAPPEATKLAPQATALPQAYALDDAPRFERFFFLTANQPIDLQQSLSALRALAQRDDSADAPLELPDGVRQWSLRLRKPDARHEDRHD